MGSDRAIGRFFVIASNNAWVHLYRDVQSMLEAKDAAIASPGAVEFFDVRGRRLAPVFSGAWTLDDLHDTGAKPDEAAVQARLHTVLEGLRGSIDVRLSKAPLALATREEVIGRLPDLSGKGLGDCYAMLESDFGDGPGGPGVPLLPRHDGSAWHNFWCH